MKGIHCRMTCLIKLKARTKFGNQQRNGLSDSQDTGERDSRFSSRENNLKEVDLTF